MDSWFMRVVLALIAINLTVLTAHQVAKEFTKEANAQGIVSVRIVGGRLDYSTDVSGGPTLEVKAVR
jgi:hypothetical protein